MSLLTKIKRKLCACAHNSCNAVVICVASLKLYKYSGMYMHLILSLSYVDMQEYLHKLHHLQTEEIHLK